MLRLGNAPFAKPCLSCGIRSLGIKSSRRLVTDWRFLLLKRSMYYKKKKPLRPRNVAVSSQPTLSQSSVTHLEAEPDSEHVWSVSRSRLL